MTPLQIQAHAKSLGFRKMISAEAGCDDLTLWVRPGDDLDDRFEAICAETGERLNVNGWLIIIIGEVGRV